MIKNYDSQDIHLTTYSIFHHIYKTQSSPNLDSWYKFSCWYLSLNNKDSENISNKIKDFPTLLTAFSCDKDSTTPYFDLFKNIQIHDHFGPKVSSLIVKTLYKIHIVNEMSDTYSLHGLPKILAQDDKFYLPVDAVITHIFKNCLKITDGSFNKVNELLQSRFPDMQDFLIWDDLWYWGFLTQKGSGKDRKVELNPAKYFSNIHSDPNKKQSEEIFKLAEGFIKLTMSK